MNDQFESLRHTPRKDVSRGSETLVAPKLLPRLRRECDAGGGAQHQQRHKANRRCPPVRLSVSWHNTTGHEKCGDTQLGLPLEKGSSRFTYAADRRGRRNGSIHRLHAPGTPFVERLQMMRFFILAIVLCSVVSSHACSAEDGGAKDPFPAGSVWMGDMRLAKEDSRTGQAALTVAERNGETFKGALVVKGPGGRVFTFEVTGTAPTKAAGAVICETPKEGLQQLKLRGKLSNGVTTLGVVGTSPFGDKGAAAIVLKQKL